MNKVILIISALLISLQTQAQDSTLQSIGGILDNYFKAAETSDSAERYEAFADLFTENGSISSIVVNSDGSNRAMQGTWMTYIDNSISYYKRFSPTFIENSREMEFYSELATVHSLVSQLSKQKTSGKTFQERYWMQFDLVFLDNRWYIDNILWINEFQGLSIENALVTDTLLYRPD